MTPENRIILEDKATNLGKAIFLLVNPTTKLAKNDLRLAYAKGNHSAYSENVEKIGRLLLS